MNLEITFEYEPESNRWFAMIEAIRGVAAYGNTKEESAKNVKILALQVIADFVEHNEMAEPDMILFTVSQEAIAA